MVDVTRKDLYLDFPLMTKAGTPWRCKGGYRVKWEDIEKSGTIIKTHFNTYTFIKAFKVNKVWYWTLSDGNCNITIKRDQARKNKKIPKDVVKTFLLTSIDRIDWFVKKANYLVKEHNKKITDNNQRIKRTFDDVKNRFKDEVDSKIAFIANFFYSNGGIREVYKELCFAYHPDYSQKETGREISAIRFHFKKYLK